LTTQYPASDEYDNQSESHHRMAQIFRMLLLVASIVLPPMVLIPIQIHLAESEYFAAGLVDISAVLLSMGLAVMLLVLLAALVIRTILPAPVCRLLTAAALGMAVLVWLQGQVLLWDYGVLDGREIIDSGWSTALAVDSLIWASVLVGVFLGRRWLVGLAAPICGMLLLIQLIPVALALSNYSAPSGLHRYNFSERDKFSFSRDQNVILIILDAYQADIFQELIQGDPQWREEFDGFTFFRNALAGYSKTYPSLALMLTGKWYDNQQPIQDFLHQAFDDRSLPRILRDRNWQVDLFPHFKRLLPISPDLASNVEPTIGCETRRTEAGRLLDLGWFRVSPHWVKSFWLNDYHWRLAGIVGASCQPDSGDDSNGHSPAGETGGHHAALRFVHEMEERADLALNRPAFKLYHLLIPHAPFHLDEDLQVRRLEDGRTGFQRQSQATLEVMKRFLRGLREIGAYDNSVIAIVSDHGGGEYVSEIQADHLPDELLIRLDDNDDIPGTHLVSGLPLVLIKPPGLRGRMEVSDVPVSLADLARTIADFTVLGTELPGENMFRIEADRPRNRRYLHYQFRGWHGDYLPAMTEYLVEGFSWSASSWHASGRVLASPVLNDEGRTATLSIGREIRFMPDSPYNEFLLEGWSPPDPNGLVWSRSDRASIKIILNAPVAGDLLVRFDFLPYTAGGSIDPPEIRLSVNNILDHQWASTGRRGWHDLQIPAEIVSDVDFLRFDFEFPDAVSPLELGLSPDVRRLGIGLYRLQLEHAINGGNE